MPKPLDERIAAAMSNGARAATVAALIEELGVTISAAEAEHSRLDTVSKSATASEDEAEQAADGASKLQRKVVRLAAKREQLEGRHSELMNSERRCRAEAEYEEVRARRDQLAADLQERWPALTDEIVALLDRIKATDAECQRVNADRYGREWLASAEALARDCPATFTLPYGGTILRFQNIKLPSLRGQGNDTLAWPRHSNPLAALDAAQAARSRQEVERRAQAERVKRYVVTPPVAGPVRIETAQGGAELKGPRILHLAPDQVAAAEAQGCAVTLAKPEDLVGLPSGAPSF